MSAPELLLVRAGIILDAPRPQPEPSETEVRAVLEHLGATAEAPAEAETAEAGR